MYAVRLQELKKPISRRDRPDKIEAGSHVPRRAMLDRRAVEPSALGSSMKTQGSGCPPSDEAARFTDLRL
jgi:hypothetical protein